MHICPWWHTGAHSISWNGCILLQGVIVPSFINLPHQWMISASPDFWRCYKQQCNEQILVLSLLDTIWLFPINTFLEMQMLRVYTRLKALSYTPAKVTNLNGYSSPWKGLFPHTHGITWHHLSLRIALEGSHMYGKRCVWQENQLHSWPVMALPRTKVSF